MELKSIPEPQCQGSFGNVLYRLLKYGKYYNMGKNIEGDRNALHNMAYSFIELCKPLCHDKAVICEGKIKYTPIFKKVQNA